MPPKTAGKAPATVVPKVTEVKTTALKRGRKPGVKVHKKPLEASYKIYIHKVLKQVHPDAGISQRAMSIMNSFIIDSFDRIAGECGRLVRMTKRKTLSARDVQAAVRLVLPGELAKHAVSEGTKAVTKFASK
eukprot:TRINITY_DN200_c0_g1_i2.p1 TRINITY_DN200_c0_g1~~TRINITY_DN200_c0_g1_i2.p1  ORF type:complete len:153 (-),score=33.48 TRINITY_DN200_c0_g1_i2:63-458(-)